MDSYLQQFLHDNDDDEADGSGNDDNEREERSYHSSSDDSASSSSSSSTDLSSSSSEDDGEEIRALFVLSDHSDDDEDEDEDEDPLRRRLKMNDAHAENDADNQALEEALKQMYDIEIPFNVQWYDRAAIQHHLGIWRALRNAVSVLHGKRYHVRPSLVHRLFERTYQLIISHLPALLAAPEGASDEYRNTPLLTMYRGCMVFFDYLHRVNALGRVQFFDPGTEAPDQNDYIRQHHINVCTGTVSSYSAKKLIWATLQLESRWRELPLHADLENYVRALELGVAKLMVWTFARNTHNVREGRIAASRTGHNEFYLSNENAFRLALRMAALHEEMDSALLFYDRYARAPTFPLLPDAQQLERMRTMLAKEAKDVHDDAYQDSVRPAYQHMRMRPSECYLFHKLNKTAKSVEPMKLIEMFGEPHLWRQIVNASNVDADLMIAQCKDTVSVRVAITYLMDILCKQTLGIRFDWYHFYWPANSFHHPTDVFIESRLHETDELPHYCHLMNDACVFYKRSLVSFGSSPEAHLKALWYWISIVQYRLMGRITEFVRAHELYETITGRPFRQSGALQSDDQLIPFPEDQIRHVIENVTVTNDRHLILWSRLSAFCVERGEVVTGEDVVDSNTAMVGSQRRQRKRRRHSNDDGDEDEDDWGELLLSGDQR